MATEIITSYPLPQWPTLFGQDDAVQQQILKRLGAIEERLSRIEQHISSNQPTE